MLKRIALGSLAVLVVVLLAGVSAIAWQGNRLPDTTGEFVALGSSYAAGIGIGNRAPGSPNICMRTAGSYPARAATLLDMTLVSATCSGSTTAHILHGGQAFQPPQLSAVGPAAKLVTITAGGNDVGYIAELVVMAGNFGPLGKWFLGDVKPAGTRDYASVTRNLVQTVEQIRKTAPAAKIMIVSYPAVLPPTGNCAILGIDDKQANISREVARRLEMATRDAALQTGAIYVDAAAASIGHDACSAAPWVHGAEPEQGAAFHPNDAGAAAVAGLVVRAAKNPA